MTTHQVVSREAWTTARKQLLQAEKEFTRRRDELSRERRNLPWVKVDKNYIFDTPTGKKSLAELFGDHSQLINSIVTRLWPMGDETVFLPGHGQPSTFAQERATNPFVADSALA